jgi:hypothetical protein
MSFNNNVTISIFRDVAMQLAAMWVRYVRPTPFEGVFHIGAVEVEVKVREIEPNTKPIKGMG